MQLNTAISQRFIIVLLISELCISAMYFLEQFVSARNSAAIHLDSALMETSQATALPMTWVTPLGQRETRTFRFEFFLQQPGAALQIYLPSYEQRLQLTLNGHPLSEESFRNRWTGPSGTATSSIEVSPDLLLSGRNQLEVAIGSGPHNMLGSLSPLMVAAPEEIAFQAKLRSFLEYDFKLMMFAALLLIGFFCFIFVWYGGLERSFLWLGYTLITSSIYSAGVLEPTFPGIIEWVPPLFSLLLISTLCLLGFLYYYLEMKPPRLLAPLILLIGTSSLLLIWSGVVTTYQLFFGFTAPASILDTKGRPPALLGRH